MGLMGSIFVSIATGILVVELYVWEPVVSRFLLKLAVRKAPPEEQDRLREEWQAHWDELPAGTGRLISAVGFVWSALMLKRISQGSGRRLFVFLMEVFIVRERLRGLFTRHQPSPVEIFTIRRIQALANIVEDPSELSEAAIREAWSRTAELAWDKLSMRLRRQIIADIQRKSDDD